MLVLIMALAMVSDPEQPTIELTRAEELRIAREEKAQHLTAPKRNALEKGLYEFRERRIMERFQAGLFGFHPLVGGMQTGSGFALGTSWSRGIVETSAQVSFKGYQKYGVSLSAPPLMNNRVSARLRAEYRNYSQERFFGVGQDSRKEDRADYRLEDYTIAGDVVVHVTNNVRAGGTVGWIETHIGEGTGTRIPSLSSMSYVSGLSAFDKQPRYVETGAFVDMDYRDEPGNPRAGAQYTARWSSFHDRDFGEYGFNRIDIEIQQYFPFFNQRRVIALRVKTALTETSDGQQVPFYMLPSLGGSQDLRGFSELRFRDNNMVVFNAEYRWEAFSGLDMALFGDAGQVASRISDFDFGAMKTAAGIGFRFNTAKKVFARVDVAFSQEGPRVSLNFNHAF